MNCLECGKSLRNVRHSGACFCKPTGDPYQSCQAVYARKHGWWTPLTPIALGQLARKGKRMRT